MVLVKGKESKKDIISEQLDALDKQKRKFKKE